MSHHPTALPPTAPTPPFLQRMSPEAIRQVVVIRVSQVGLEALLSQAELGMRVHAQVPAVQRLAEMPDGILLDNLAGESLRRAHGFVTIQRRDASPHAQSPSMVMGYAVPAGPDGLVMFIHDTAADANVFVPGDPIPRVAFGELMLSLFAGCPSLEDAHFNEFARMVRNELEAQRLYEGARRFGVRLWVGQAEVDLITSGGKMLANIAGNQAAAERDVTRRRTTGGVLNALHSGGDGLPPAWPYAPSALPLGYGPVLDADGAPRTRAGSGHKKWKLIAPNLDEVEAVREMLRLVARGERWVDCAEPLARARVSGRGSHWGKRTYADLPRGRRGVSLAEMVSNSDHRRLWLTGRYVRTKEVPVANDGTFEGFTVTPRHGTYGAVEIDVDLGLPDGGFMDEQTAQLIEQRLARRETKDGERSTTCAMFAYIRPYRDVDGPEFRWERRLRRHGGTYVVHQRPAADAVARGWDHSEGHQILSVRADDLENDVARAVRDAVVDVADDKLAIHVREAGPNDPARELEARIHDLECRIAEEEAAGSTADRIAQIAASPDTYDPAAVARHSTTATAHYATAEQLRSTAAELRSSVDKARSAQPEHVLIDLSTPAAVAGCLVGYAGSTMPLVVNQALRKVGLETLRLDLDPLNPSRVLWSLRFDLPLADGGTADVVVSGVVRNRRRDPSVINDPHRVDAAIAEGFLRECQSIDTLQVAFGMSRAGIVTAVRRHLSRHGVTKRGLRAAIVDLPAEMLETRQALWSVISGSDSGAAEPTPLVAYLGRVYRGDLEHPNAWVRADTTLVRKALQVMLTAAERGEDGVSIEVLARTVGASLTEIRTLCGDRRGTGSTGARFRGVLVRDKVNPSIVRLRPCPHTDCSAAKGSRWLSHYLPVPETDGYHGLICPDCHRLPDPDLADLYLPSAYVDHLWDGPSNAAHFDLCAGPATAECDAAAYRPDSRLPRETRIYSISEAATELGITDAALRRWISDEDEPLPCKRMTGHGGLKYGITGATLAQARSNRRLAVVQKRSPRPAGVPGDVITLRELSHRTGVAEHYLRRRATEGGLGPHEYRNLAGGGAAHLVVSRAVLNDAAPLLGTALLPAEWIERHQHGFLLIGEAAERSGQSAAVIREAVRSCLLRSYVTDGGTHRFAERDVEAWAAQRRQACLTPKAAALRAGVTTEALRGAVERGELQPAAVTPGGHRRYAVADVDAWARGRC